MLIGVVRFRFLFIKNLPALPDEYRNRKCRLPKKTRLSPPVSLVLDLDETLVHCSVQQIQNWKLKFSVNFNGLDYDVSCVLVLFVSRSNCVRFTGLRSNATFPSRFP